MIERLGSSSSGAYGTLEDRLVEVGIDVWRTVLWETQWGQMDSGSGLGRGFGRIGLCTRCARSDVGLVPSSVTFGLVREVSRELALS